MKQIDKIFSENLYDSYSFIIYNILGKHIKYYSYGFKELT